MTESNEELFTQIIPFGIHLVDQGNLLLPRTTFGLFLAGDGFGHGREIFEINQLRHIVFAGKSFHHFILVSGDSVNDIARHACVQYIVIFISQNVDTGMKFSFHESLLFSSFPRFRHCEEGAFPDEAISWWWKGLLRKNRSQ